MISSGSVSSDAPSEPTSWLDRVFLYLAVKNWLRLCALILLLVSIIIAFVVFDAEQKLEDILEWIDDHEAPGFFIFVMVYCLATGQICSISPPPLVGHLHDMTVLFIPGSLLSLGAGFVFGIWLGALAVWCGAVMGQSSAFRQGMNSVVIWVESRSDDRFPWRSVSIPRVDCLVCSAIPVVEGIGDCQ